MRFGDKEFEVVRRSGNRAGYIRAKPDRENPTPAQLQNQLRFGKAAFNSFGEKEVEDLPPAALAVRDAFVDGKTKEVVDLLKRSKAEELLSSGEFDSAEEIIKLLQNID